MNNFKDYGFEADFEGEIYTSYRSNDNQIFYNGAIWFKSNDDYHYMKPVSWTEKGEVIHYYFQENYLTSYRLKPIKKEWYENAESRFKLVMYQDGLYTLSWWYKDTSNVELIDIKKATTQAVNVKDVRPATKEEVLALLVKE